VSATRTAEESFLLLELEEEARLELDEVATVFEELLDKFFSDELDRLTDEDCAESDELDSSTALLSPLSGPELLASSPQATKPMHTKNAINTKNFESLCIGKITIKSIPYSG
jgi:hypothetical protein